MFTIRRCQTGFLSNDRRWKKLRSFNDEASARESFNRIVPHRYPSRVLGYELVGPQGAIMSAWSVRLD